MLFNQVLKKQFADTGGIVRLAHRLNPFKVNALAVVEKWRGISPHPRQGQIEIVLYALFTRNP